MNRIQALVLKTLKEELEQNEDGYSQWIMAVSIGKIEREFGTHGTPFFTARVVIKTSESPYVDGADIEVTMILGEVVVDADSLPDGPIFHGGTIEHALNWVRQLEEPYYIQLDNPFES